MLWIKKLASGSFLVLSTHILYFHTKNLAVLDISRFTFCKVDYYDESHEVWSAWTRDAGRRPPLLNVIDIMSPTKPSRQGVASRQLVYIYHTS